MIFGGCSATSDSVNAPAEVTINTVRMARKIEHRDVGMSGSMFDFQYGQKQTSKAIIAGCRYSRSNTAWRTVNHGEIQKQSAAMPLGLKVSGQMEIGGARVRPFRVANSGAIRTMSDLLCHSCQCPDGTAKLGIGIISEINSFIDEAFTISVYHDTEEIAYFSIMLSFDIWNIGVAVIGHI